MHGLISFDFNSLTVIHYYSTCASALLILYVPISNICKDVFCILGKEMKRHAYYFSIQSNPYIQNLALEQGQHAIDEILE